MTNNFQLKDKLNQRKQHETYIQNLMEEKNISYEEAWKMYYLGVWECATELKNEARSEKRVFFGKDRKLEVL